MPTFNFYSAWMDPVFYAWALVAAGGLVGLIYSIRRYLELKNAAFEEELPAEAGDLPAPVLEESDPDTVAEQQELPEQPELPAARPGCLPPAAEQHAADPSRAETFVRGIYEGIAGLDNRLKGLEASLSKSRVNNDFTVKFLEDILADIDSLDKVKLKARIEYLLTDLKK